LDKEQELKAVHLVSQSQTLFQYFFFLSHFGFYLKRGGCVANFLDIFCYASCSTKQRNLYLFKHSSLNLPVIAFHIFIRCAFISASSLAGSIFFSFYSSLFLSHLAWLGFLLQSITIIIIILCHRIVACFGINIWLDYFPIVIFGFCRFLILNVLLQHLSHSKFAKLRIAREKLNPVCHGLRRRKILCSMYWKMHVFSFGLVFRAFLSFPLSLSYILNQFARECSSHCNVAPCIVATEMGFCLF
jgi:hypothetical protein